MKVHSVVAVVAIGAVLAVGVGTTGAVADRLIGSGQIKPGAVKSKHIDNATITSSDLSSALRSQLSKAGRPGPKGDTGTPGAQGPQGVAGATGAPGAPGADASIVFRHAATVGQPTITHIGGPIKTRFTDLDTSITLQPGTYRLSVDGEFLNTAALAAGAQVYPQLSVWTDRDNDNEFDYSANPALTEGGISPNALMPRPTDRHIHVAGTTVITVTNQTDVQLVAFGYDSEGGAAGSGQIKVSRAEISALKVA